MFNRFQPWCFLTALALIALPAAPACVFAAPAKKPAPKTPAKEPAKKQPEAGPTKPGTGQALKLGQYEDWIAYATPGAKKICYALSVPKDREPKKLVRDPGYLFVSFRPDEKVRGEIAVVMGYPVKEDGPSQAIIGSTTFELAGKGASLFVHNPAQEGQMLAAMKHGGNLVVKASSKRGNGTVDTFSLAGIGQALEQAEKACK